MNIKSRVEQLENKHHIGVLPYVRLIVHEGDDEDLLIEEAVSKAGYRTGECNLIIRKII